MPGFHINSLSARERRQLTERAFSLDELAELHAALARGQAARKRAFRLVSVFVIAVTLVLFGMTAQLTGPTPALAFTGGMLAVLVVGLLVVLWVLTIALYARQFNDAVDEGYPELLGRYHL